MKRTIWAGVVLPLLLAPNAGANPIFVDGDIGDDAWNGLCPLWDGAACGPKATSQAGIMERIQWFGVPAPLVQRG